jgi:outer membrane protein insertion porin family
MKKITMMLAILALAGTLCTTTAGAEDTPPAAKPCTRIKRIELTGNTHFSSARLKPRLKIWSSSLLPGKMNCLNENWLKQDIKDLIAFYRKKGFAQVSMDTRTLPIPGKKKHIVEIIIQEGPLYEISFKGNAFFSHRQLKKEITIFEKGDPNGAGLRKGKTSIQKKYMEAGFANVEVALESQTLETKPSDLTRQVIYRIKEGTQQVVKQLDITGNNVVETSKIRNAMIIHSKGLMDVGGFNLKTLEKDLEAIDLVYFSQGFLNAKITHDLRMEKEKDTKANSEESQTTQQMYITIHIIEGPRTLVNSAEISGLGNIISQEEALELLTLSPGEPFRDYMVRSDANVLAAKVSEKGYPHVKVTGEMQLNPAQTLADITWQVQPGVFTRFGEIHYAGNKRLKQKIMEKKLDIIQGEPFSMKQLFTTQKKVREIYSVESVKITAPGLKTQELQPDIDITIKERKPYYVEVAAGFDTENLGYLKVKTGDTNFMGKDMNAWVEGYISGIGHRVEAGVKDPFFLDTLIAATFTIYEEKEEPLNQEFGTRTWGAESAFARRLTPHLTAGLNFEYENRVQLGGENENQEETRNILITSSSLAWDNRDSVLKPTRGFLSFASVDLFSGFGSDLDRFLKYQLDARHYRSPFKGLTFAMAGRMGYIQPLGSSNTVADDQLFFLGGISDVRGFRENMLLTDPEYDDRGLGGRKSISASLEARIDLPANFELTFFLDTGKIDDTDRPEAVNDFRYAVGTGLRYNTPIGPIGLLYGHKLDPENGESPGQIHFSIGYTF